MQGKMIDRDATWRRHKGLVVMCALVFGVFVVFGTWRYGSLLANFWIGPASPQVSPLL
jgi:hypothetical protein